MENHRLRIRLVSKEEDGTIDLETLRDALDAILGCLKACERVVQENETVRQPGELLRATNRATTAWSVFIRSDSTG